MGWNFRELGTRICVCYNVTNQQALDTWRDKASVAELTRKFHCGQNCGMCLPYFHTLLDEYQRGEWPAGEAAKPANDWFGIKKAQA